MSNPDLLVFRVERDTAHGEIDSEVMGWGVAFPSGLCVVDWYLEAFPPENRLDNAHLSQYGSLSDVEQGTGGVVEPIETFAVTP